MERKKLNFYVVVETGLHIGGQAEYEIAAIDNVVVKDPQGFPYIPGSSLKGKVRSLLEIQGQRGNRSFSNLDDDVNKPSDEKQPRICKCGKCAVCRVFGYSSNKQSQMSKVIFRDVYISREEPQINDYQPPVDFIYRDEGKTPRDFLEVKFENTIDRYNAKASNPRQTERVVPGTVFSGKIIMLEDGELEEPYNSRISHYYEKLDKRFKVNNANDYLKLVLIGLSLLEDDYLGGSGTRGYGAVKVFLRE